MSASVRWRRYVALGDSFTEGMDDPHPAGMGYRGWADLVAARLAKQAPDLRYANLAVRGRLFQTVVDDQVPLALAMHPDLVSFAAGGNDVMRRRCDPEQLLAGLDEVVGEFRRTGADVIIFRFADVTVRLPGARLMLPRVELLNIGVGEVARRHGAILVDLWRDKQFHDVRLWSQDRLHMSARGHRRVAGHVLNKLGVAPDPKWLAPLGRPEPTSWLAARRGDARWAWQHLAPWIHRRLTGRSSGDQVTAKRPSLATVVD